MTDKTKNIVHWFFAGLIGFIFIASGINKLIGSEETLKMVESLGLTASSFKILAVVEIIAAILFIIPRTGILGTLLLVAYMGGAIATHLEHNESIVAPCIISAFLWMVAVIRFPELKHRILGK